MARSDCDQVLAQPPHALRLHRHQGPCVQRHHDRLVAARSVAGVDLKYCMDMRGSASGGGWHPAVTTGKDTAVAIPIILDCDPGTDDAFALLLALASPEIEVLAVTVAGGNVGLECTLPNALALVALAGADVPVYAGADRPLLGAFVNETRVHGIDGLGGIALPRRRRTG